MYTYAFNFHFRPLAILFACHFKWWDSCPEIPRLTPDPDSRPDSLVSLTDVAIGRRFGLVTLGYPSWARRRLETQTEGF